MSKHDLFSAIAREHAPWLLRWFQSRVPASVEAEDLVQETLIALYRNQQTLRDEGRVGAYLYAAAVRIRNRVLERERRRLAIEREAARLQSAHTDDPRQGLLASALRQLPDELSAAVAVYFARDVTYEEAAERLGVTRATFQSRLRRALELLRRHVEQRAAAEGRAS